MEEFPSSEWGFDPNEIHNDGSVTVHSWVKIGDIKRRMQLPVMNKKKNAEVNPDARVINDNKMRCLTKNLAVWGLGLHVFHGEDFPSEVDDEEKPADVGRTKEKHKKEKIKAVKNENKKQEEEVNTDNQFDEFSIFDEEEEKKEKRIPDFDEDEGDSQANVESLEITNHEGKPVRFSKKGDNDFSLIIEQFLKFAKMNDTADSLKEYWITNGNLVLQIKKENPEQFNKMRSEFSEYGKNVKR
jgi:hypothetical protein